jgi:hypothetical protein
MMDDPMLGQWHRGRKMNTFIVAGVEHVDTCADLSGLLPHGGSRDPAALLAAPGAVGPCSSAVELVREVELCRAATEVEHGCVVGMYGGECSRVGPKKIHDCLLGSWISATHLPHFHIRTPRYCLPPPHAPPLMSHAFPPTTIVAVVLYGFCWRSHRGLRRGVEGGGGARALSVQVLRGHSYWGRGRGRGVVVSVSCHRGGDEGGRRKRNSLYAHLRSQLNVEVH